MKPLITQGISQTPTESYAKGDIMTIQSWAAGSGEGTGSTEIRSWFEATDCRVTGTSSGKEVKADIVAYPVHQDQLIRVGHLLLLLFRFS